LAKYSAKKHQSHLYQAYANLAEQMGFKKRSTFSNWKKHNQTLANELISRLVGLNYKELDFEFIGELKRLVDEVEIDEEKRYTAQIIQLLIACGAELQGNISLSIAGDLLTTNDCDKKLLKGNLYYKNLFEKLDDYLRWHTELDMNRIDGTEIYSLARLGCVLGINSRWEGKQDW
jgi:hypothetical protein